MTTDVVPTEQDVVHTEEHRVSGERLLSKIKEIVHKGNIRRIIIKNDQGQVLIEVPLTLGVVGFLLAPVWVALGAMAALVADFNIVVEKTEQKAPAGDVGETPAE
jgi:hypothetical protein